MADTGFTSLTVGGIPVLGSGPLTTGEMFIVDDSQALAADSAYNGSADLPMRTIGFAHTTAVANRGDVIVIGANHSQAKSVALALTSKAGVSFVHLASGTSWMVQGSARLVGVGAERIIKTPAAVMVTGTTIFTVSGGPILILELVSVCVTLNDATASTLQWSADGTDGAAATFTGASASLADATPGTMAVCLLTATTTAPVLYTAGVGISRAAGGNCGGMVVPAGIITTTIGVGSTTGTWSHHLLYRPLAPGVQVV